MFSPSVLWSAPDVNPVNHKARSIPVFNPINKYGRVFFFSWFGFFIAFWSWYAFPPLLTRTIKTDLHMTTKDVANSNIAALTATLLVRFVAGPLCDRFGPRWTFIGVLLTGAIPTALSGTARSTGGLITIRFFVGILGGSFVPCQVWSTGFFDKNVVGTSNALIGGWGNSGGGITYFVMPAILDSLVHRGLTPHVAWRVAFIVPFIMIVVTALGMILFCEDTPTGKWSERHLHAQQNLVIHGVTPPFNADGAPNEKASSTSGSSTPPPMDEEKRSAATKAAAVNGHEVSMAPQEMQDIAKGEIVQKPSIGAIFRLFTSPQVLFHAATYFCSFGGELAINSYLGAYYFHHFPKLGQTGNSNWAAMFGLLNVATRPLGGVAADIIYKYTGSLWAKKMLIVFVGLVSGIFLIAIGFTDPNSHSRLIGLIAGMAIFLEAGNGANFALVPHVHPHANGVVSGITGAVGNLGGIVFAIVFRFHGVEYAKSIYITGFIIIGMNLILCWVNPIPKGQIGGR